MIQFYTDQSLERAFVDTSFLRIQPGFSLLQSNSLIAWYQIWNSSSSGYQWIHCPKGKKYPANSLRSENSASFQPHGSIMFETTRGPFQMTSCIQEDLRFDPYDAAGGRLLSKWGSQDRSDLWRLTGPFQAFTLWGTSKRHLLRTLALGSGHLLDSRNNKSFYWQWRSAQG